MKKSPSNPEKREIDPMIAEYILRNPDHVFAECEKTFKHIMSTGQRITKGAVSIIYRKEVGDPKSPTFMEDQLCVSWLLTEGPRTVNSPTELVTAIESLSGLKAENLVIQSSGEVEAASQKIASQIQQQLPQGPAGEDSEEDDDNDATAWVIENSNRHND